MKDLLGARNRIRKVSRRLFVPATRRGGLTREKPAFFGQFAVRTRLFRCSPTVADSQEFRKGLDFRRRHGWGISPPLVAKRYRRREPPKAPRLRRFALPRGAGAGNNSVCARGLVRSHKTVSKRKSSRGAFCPGGAFRRRDKNRDAEASVRAFPHFAPLSESRLCMRPLPHRFDDAAPSE